MRVEVFNRHAVLDTDDDELFGKIRAFFAIPDKLYNPRAGHYDSTTDFIMPDGTLPIGLLSDALELLQAENIKYELFDYRSNLAKFDLDKLANPIKPFGTMRAYQAESLINYANRLRTTDFKESGIFEHATNAGKSYIIASLLEALVEGYAFILVHDSSLYMQLREFLAEAGFEVGYIRGTTVIPGNVIVCMYKSVINRFYEFEPTLLWLVEEASLLIVDECHKASGNEYYMLINTLGVATRIGFSGTPFAAKLNAAKIRVRASFGDVIDKISVQQLDEAGVNAKLVVNILLHDAPLKAAGSLSYNEVYKINIVNSSARTALIIEAVAKHTSGNILITVNELAHVDLLYKALLEAYPDDDISYLVGGYAEATLAEFRHKFQRSSAKRQILVTDIWQEGINISIDVLVYAQGGSSEIELVQYKGRILRLTSEVKCIYDFYDLGIYAESHSKARIELYARDGHKIIPNYAYKPGTYEPLMSEKHKNLKLF